MRKKFQRTQLVKRPLFVLVMCIYNICVGSVHRESLAIIAQQDATICRLLYFCKPLNMFRVVTPPIIRSTCNSVITASGTGQTVSATFRFAGAVGTAVPTAPTKRKVAETV
jgi:hypothetical protein